MKPEPYPDPETYEVLYAKYLQTPADTLLKLADFQPGQCFLDLCSGNGRQSIAAFDMGASVVSAVDESLAMLEGKNYKLRGINAIPSPIDVYLNRPIGGMGGPSYLSAATFDVIACQQAVNNWLTKETAERIPLHLYSSPKHQGTFVFNTFNEKPWDKPQTKEYWLPIKSTKDTVTSRKYVEVLWMSGDIVHHIQIAEGFEPHYTSFRYIWEDEYRAWLEPHFDIKLITKGATDYYICKVKK